jgi:small-conductance mechanosensitive channel
MLVFTMKKFVRLLEAILLSLFLAYLGYWILERTPDDSWQSATAVVVSKTKLSDNSGYSIGYKYEVDNVEYLDESTADGVIGEKMEIFYNPNNPAQSSLTTQPKYQLFFNIVGYGLIVFGIYGVLTVRRYVR